MSDILPSRAEMSSLPYRVGYISFLTWSSPLSHCFVKILPYPAVSDISNRFSLIALMMEAVCTCKTSVLYAIETAGSYIPEGCCQNLKSHFLKQSTALWMYKAPVTIYIVVASLAHLFRFREITAWPRFFIVFLIFKIKILENSKKTPLSLTSKLIIKLPFSFMVVYKCCSRESDNK